MGILGKLVGAGLGMFIGGPIGAVLGGVLGHQYDKAEQQQRRRIGSRGPSSTGGAHSGYRDSRFQSSYSTQDYQTIFMVSLISMAAKIAKADGNVSREEVAVLDSFLRDQLHMGTAERKTASQIFNQAKNHDGSHRDFAQEFAQLFRGNRDMLATMVHLLFKIAAADGNIAPAEETMIRDIAGIFGLSAGEYEQVRSFYATDTDKYYRILGCTPQSSDAEIKKAYRSLVSEYHPDKIISRGLPEDFMEFANEKLKDINEAYGKIKKERGL